MKKYLALVVIVIFCWSCSKNSSETADSIYINGKIYTVNEAQPWAEAVAIKDGTFLKVGSNDDILALKGEKTIVINLKEQFAMPGIVDMHAHPFTGVDMGIGMHINYAWHCKLLF